MSFDDNFLKIRNSFSTQIAYTGPGHARFSGQVASGWVKGPVQVEIDERGKIVIEMVIQDFHVESEIETTNDFSRLNMLLMDRKPHIEGSHEAFINGSYKNLNTCTELRVQTETGVFTADSGILHYILGRTRLGFSVLHPTFRSHSAQSEVYWVFPLLNFVSLNRDFIEFKFRDSNGYIIGLSDYAERKTKLNSRNATELITALMMAKTYGEGWKLESMPLDFLELLSLASGNLIGIPWIEFQDAQGNLVRRIHISSHISPYFKGHETLLPSGTAQLLSYAPLPLDAEMRTAIMLTVKGSGNHLDMIDSALYFFRALDTLCKQYKQESKPKEFLDSVQVNQLQEAIKQARSAIDEIRNNLQNNDAARKFLDAVFEKISKAGNLRQGFGRMVSRLMEEHNLPDEEIVNNYYRNNPRGDKKNWREVLMGYRGIAVHQNYFEISAGSTDIEDVLRITYHVHDILLRIILKKLNYGDNYRYKRAVSLKSYVTVNWVTSDTSADELGYGVSLLVAYRATTPQPE